MMRYRDRVALLSLGVLLGYGSAFSEARRAPHFHGASHPEAPHESCWCH